MQLRKNFFLFLPRRRTQLPARLYSSQVFSSPSSIMENAIRRREGQLDNRRGRRKMRSVMWQSRGTRQSLAGRRAKVISPFLAAAAWIVFAFGRRPTPKPHGDPKPFGRRMDRADTSSRVSAREAHPVLLLLLENTCLLSVHPSIGETETNGERRGEGGTTCLLPVTALAQSDQKQRERERERLFWGNVSTSEFVLLLRWRVSVSSGAAIRQVTD